MINVPISYLYLGIAVIAEVVGTTSLKYCEEFTKPIPSILVVICYIIAFYCLMLCLRTFPVSIAYAIWCGLGIVLVAIMGWVLYGEKLDMPAIIGMALIIVGTVIIQFFSQTAGH
jgi:small multidrug resistance pump